MRRGLKERSSRPRDTHVDVGGDRYGGGALLAAAITLGLASDLGDTTTVVRAPASPATQVVTGDRPTGDFALHGRGTPVTGGLTGAATNPAPWERRPRSAKAAPTPGASRSERPTALSARARAASTPEGEPRR